jgi:hypothetical protein
VRQIKPEIGKEVAITKALSILRNWKCKVYDNQIVPSEVTKEQRLIFESTNVMEPKVCGI